MSTLRAGAASALAAMLLAGCGATGEPKPSGPIAPVPPRPPAAPSAPVPAPPSTARQMADQYIRYRCENGFDFGVTYQAGGTRALVERSGYSDLLRLTPSASGARYTDGKLTLSARGDGAVLEQTDGPTYRNCRSQPAKPPAPRK